MLDYLHKFVCVNYYSDPVPTSGTGAVRRPDSSTAGIMFQLVLPVHYYAYHLNHPHNK